MRADELKDERDRAHAEKAERRHRASTYKRRADGPLEYDNVIELSDCCGAPMQWRADCLFCEDCGARLQ